MRSSSQLISKAKTHFWKLFLFFLVVLIIVGYKVTYSAWDNYRLRQIEDKWNGFGKRQKGFYDFTVVTGLFDIGRGRWWTQSRTYNEYLGYLMQILMLDVNLVVFIEKKGTSFVEKARQGRNQRTKVIPTELHDLEYYPLLPKIKKIMSSSLFQENNTNYQHGLPEGTDPLYNLVTNSKTTLMHQVVSTNPFNNKYFVWLDGGYGHGDPAIYPSDGVWHPRHLLSHPDQVTFIAFESLSADRLDEVKTLHKQKTAWMAGGLFAGGSGALERLYYLHKQMMNEYMARGTIDDDQTTFVDCVIRDPKNFRPVKGSWYDLMKPFR